MSGFAFTNLKKFLRVPRGVFSKTLLGRVWDSVPQKERASLYGRVCLFRRGKVPARNTNRPSGFAFTNLKKFLGIPRGVFSKTLLGREWDSVPEKEKTPELAQTERVPTPVRGHLQEAEAVNQRR